jgi:ribosomal protein S19
MRRKMPRWMHPSSSPEDVAKAKAELAKLQITPEMLGQMFWDKYVENEHSIRTHLRHMAVEPPRLSR